MQVRIFLSISSMFIMLMFHYSSNDDDTGNKYGNDGAAPTKNSDEKMLVGFLDPSP